MYAALGPDDCDSFLMELSGFLRECSKLCYEMMVNTPCVKKKQAKLFLL